MRMPKALSHVWVTIGDEKIEAICIGTSDPEFYSLTGKKLEPDSWRYRVYKSKKKK